MLPSLGFKIKAPSKADFKKADLDGNGKLDSKELVLSKKAIKIMKGDYEGRFKKKIIKGD